MGGNCWSRGPESQKASAIWLGGVSAVISASDLDEHSFGVGRYKSNEHEGALPDPGGSLESEDGVPGSEMRSRAFRALSDAAALAATVLLASCTGGEALKRFEFKSDAMGSQVGAVDAPVLSGSLEIRRLVFELNRWVLRSGPERKPLRLRMHGFATSLG